MSDKAISALTWEQANSLIAMRLDAISTCGSDEELEILLTQLKIIIGTHPHSRFQEVSRILLASEVPGLRNLERN